MDRFKTFGEYMFDLLFAPLKKGRRTANQFAIFFRVVGREFDELKEAVFKIRSEANIASASEIMLAVHGQDRDMPRLAGETAEGYRTRLSMKGIIASWAGTAKGIQYALAALGYEKARIEPFYLQSPSQWAEFVVDLGIGNGEAVKNLHTIYHEVQKVKEGSSKLAYFFVPHEPVSLALCFGIQATSYASTHLNRAEDIILVKDRMFIIPVILEAAVTGYSEEIIAGPGELLPGENGR